MDGVVFWAVLSSAGLHATWNTIAKAIPDQRVAAGLISAAGLGAGAVGALVLPMPAVAAWPFIASSAVLQTLYLLLLTKAYRHGEFGQVYPVARGLPPLLVTAVSLTLLKEQLSVGQLVGVIIVSAALLSLVFIGGRPGRGSGLGLAAATGAMIACYTLVDGLGVRHTDQALSYVMWLFLLQGVLVLTVCRARYGRGYWSAWRDSAPLGLIGGLIALVAYAIVVWAQSLAPLALVSALRETSLLFAGLIGTLVFGERFRLGRLAAIAATVVGIALLQTY